MYFVLLNPAHAKCKTSSNSSIVFKLWLWPPLRHIKADLRITVHRMVRHGNNLFIPLTSFDCQSFSYVLMKHSTFLTHTPKTETNNRVKVPSPTFINVCYNFVSFPVHDSLGHFLLWLNLWWRVTICSFLLPLFIRRGLRTTLFVQHKYYQYLVGFVGLLPAKQYFVFCLSVFGLSAKIVFTLVLDILWRQYLRFFYRFEPLGHKPCWHRYPSGISQSSVLSINIQSVCFQKSLLYRQSQ